MASFRAFRVEKTEDRQFPRSIVERDTADLPGGDLLIEVAYSSLNYKDALSATGNPGVTRQLSAYPGHRRRRHRGRVVLGCVRAG